MLCNLILLLNINALMFKKLIVYHKQKLIFYDDY